MLPLLNEFKEKLASEGKSPLTIKSRIQNCGYFEAWFDPKNILKASRKDIEGYKTYLMTEHKNRWGKSLVPGSVINQLVSLSIYYRFLCEKKKVFLDPTLGIKLPYNKLKFKSHYPTEKEVQTLINTPDTYTYTGIRDRLLFELMYTCPLRSVEIRRLKLFEIDMKDKYFYPSRAKGGRECGIPIVPSTFQILEKYLNISRPRLLKHAKRPVEELFVTNDGGPLSITMVNKIFAKHRGSNTEFHPHAMRRACAVHMLKNGASIRDVQVLLGHRDLNSTRHYTLLLTDDLKKMQSKHHPRDKRKRRQSKPS